MSKAYSILLQGGSDSSGKQPEAIKKDEGDVNTMGGQVEKGLGAQSATHEAEQ
jgi:SLT domain-containing protein